MTTAATPWYAAHGERIQDAIFAEMRRLDDYAQRTLGQRQRLEPPYGSIAVGAAALDPFLRGQSLAHFLDQIRRGRSPDDAGDSAKRWARGAVSTHNAKRPKDALATVGRGCRCGD
jgi:hypothetical protein